MNLCNHSKNIIKGTVIKTKNKQFSNVNRLQSCVAAPWLSSANLMPTRIECFRNFSAHLRTHVSSCFCSDLCLNVSTQSLKHLSTRELYILRLQWNLNSHNQVTPSYLHQVIGELNMQIIHWNNAKKKIQEPLHDVTPHESNNQSP